VAIFTPPFVWLCSSASLLEKVSPGSSMACGGGRWHELAANINRPRSAMTLTMKPATWFPFTSMMIAAAHILEWISSARGKAFLISSF